MDRKQAIGSAYHLTGGNNFYDGMITCSTLSGKSVCRLVWAMNKAENDSGGAGRNYDGFYSLGRNP